MCCKHSGKGTVILLFLYLISLRTVGMKHHLLDIFENIGVKMCGIKCLNSGSCRGYSYSNVTLTCLLLRFVSRGTVSGMAVVPRRHIHDVRNPCFMEQCRRGFNCLITGRGLLTCVKDFNFCGLPPQIDDTTVQYTGRYEKAVAAYTCKEDFRSCAVRTTSVCLRLGQWSFISIVCVRYRWRAPIRPFMLSNPCHRQRSLDLRINGKMTRRTRMSIYLKRGWDILLFISYKFRKTDKPSDIIVFNTCVNEMWGAPIKRAASLITVNKTFLLHITLAVGTYTVIVDSQDVMTMQDRLPGVVPNYVHAKHDVLLEQVELKLPFTRTDA